MGGQDGDGTVLAIVADIGGEAAYETTRICRETMAAVINDVLL